MKRFPTTFLQIIIGLISIATLIGLIWEPLTEGRNTSSTLFEVYFNDPFLAFAYFAFISVFVGYYNAFKILGYIRENKEFSEPALKALQMIKKCAWFFIGCVIFAECLLFLFQSGQEDIAGGVAIGLILFVGAIVTATFTDVLESIFRNGIHLKQKNTK